VTTAIAAITITGAGLPDRPAFAPPVRSDGPAVYAVAAAEASGQAQPTIAAPAGAQAVSTQTISAQSVPVPILMEALDPAKITSTAAAPAAPILDCADGWAVQIGAFGDPQVARAIAAGVRDRGFAPLAGSAVLVAEASGIGQVIYRALRVGLSDQSAADTACITLQMEGIACTPVSLESTQVAACS
jgi:D-alanyl-D-alanine carboxypeptidase